jgi:hypothetical protein
MKINPQIAQIAQIFFTKWAGNPPGGAIRENPPNPPNPRSIFIAVIMNGVHLKQ